MEGTACQPDLAERTQKGLGWTSWHDWTRKIRVHELDDCLYVQVGRLVLSIFASYAVLVGRASNMM